MQGGVLVLGVFVFFKILIGVIRERTIVQDRILSNRDNTPTPLLIYFFQNAPTGGVWAWGGTLSVVCCLSDDL